MEVIEIRNAERPAVRCVAGWLGLGCVNIVVVWRPPASTSTSFQLFPATSPLTEAILLSGTPCVAAQRHAHPAHTNASPRELRRSSAQCSKPAIGLHHPRSHSPPAAKTSAVSGG